MLDQVAELSIKLRGVNEADLSVELLYWEGCPSHPDALRMLRSLLDELGRPDVMIRLTQVDTEAQAASLRFPGSPTLRVNGADLMPAPQDAPIGLTCRVYRLRDGRPSPTPDPEALRSALRRALAADGT